ncbi:hypothetical protein VNO80_02920 [Phaseolus coccineus]|uniref:Uncharacterized protein n=1 Tax=Phaseolus coccineus TaxID=3886 RepID=A0AAN9RIC5_PHACN
MVTIISNEMYSLVIIIWMQHCFNFKHLSEFKVEMFSSLSYFLNAAALLSKHSLSFTGVILFQFSLKLTFHHMKSVVCSNTLSAHCAYTLIFFPTLKTSKNNTVRDNRFFNLKNIFL